MSDRDLIIKAAISAVASVLGTAALLSALVGCATLDFNCKSDGRIDVFDDAIVNKCLDGSAPTVTFRAKRIYGCGVEPKPTVRVIEGVKVP